MSERPVVDSRGNHHSPHNGRFVRKDKPIPSQGKASKPKRSTGDARPPRTAGGPVTGRVVQLLGRIGDDDLAVAFVKLAAEPDRPGRAEALAALDAELARRERHQPDKQAARVDELAAGGRPWLDAYAEVHGLDPAKLEAEQRAALVDANRRPGERREQTLRRMYSEHVMSQYLAAEDATAGNLLSKAGRAKGIDPRTLWSGQATRAARYASDELKAWWEAQGGRNTWAGFRAQYAGGTAARRAAQASAQRGAGRDYGV